ncbi:helix-turn-helix domain-containing protein [Sphingobacterium sp. DK4209]|uniref:Helix-turn-helix domain-containing protein n=1 Tax=Sphingobacterium zhuxiongii TaxID=2662364 RepID=A0A5Q0QC80_9SPHI|nr:MULTISPECIES: helix-turn-helix transcriptional regulator [unclassified Sphingobacterium]MVZ67447.1 helix-turn-helix domain-containing protein [Sphingobacterium sp. DK4209]QGA26461.1 helix-turn-helix domain-containing protein [Sphingobacterium sp. dk4302]
MERTQHIHEGRNIKRFREMLGMKQEALAFELGEDWTQKKVSQLEAKEAIENDIIEQVARILKVSPDAIKNFNEESVFNVINNTFQDSSSVNNNYLCTINPLEKIIELYERLVIAEKEKVTYLEELLKSKN